MVEFSQYCPDFQSNLVQGCSPFQYSRQGMLNTCSMPAFPLCQSGSSVKSCTVLSSLESPFPSSFIRFNLLDLVQMSHFVSTRCQFRLTEFRFPSPMSRVSVRPFVRSTYQFWSRSSRQGTISWSIEMTGCRDVFHPSVLELESMMNISIKYFGHSFYLLDNWILNL